MKILKFGGSSIGSPEMISAAASIIRENRDQNECFGVVISAFKGVTDTLLHSAEVAALGDWGYTEDYKTILNRYANIVNDVFANEPFSLQSVMMNVDKELKDLADILHGVYLIRELSNRTKDYILSFGEKLSALIIADVLRINEDLPAFYVDARQIIKTDMSFGKANVDFKTTNLLVKAALESQILAGQIPIITGFIASTTEGLTTTLGRGGSDYTAAILGAALNVDIVEIWTDVNGVLTTDPRLVSEAFTIPKMTYNEAMEMSHFGAKVIYAPTMLPLMADNIPLLIKNTFAPESKGTYISGVVDKDVKHPVKGIASIQNVTLITIEGGGMVGVSGTAQRLFGALARANVNIILITQASSEHSITFAVAPQYANVSRETILLEFEIELARGLLSEPRVESDLSIVAIIGENMRQSTGVSGRLFQALGKNGVNISAIAQGSSELNISVVIPYKDQRKALNVLHEAFFLSDAKVVNLFIVGVGLIGKSLLAQMQRQISRIAERQKIILRVVGLANSRKMVFSEKGIDVSDWELALNSSVEMSSNSAFIANMQALNLANSIFIDVTASREIPDLYATILESNISISTANKVAASSPYSNYAQLKSIARRKNVGFFFETNVGAGLPVLTTLNDLINSGDELVTIEAVLSGTLSYIFNTFDGSIPFSEVVQKAQDLGYTEPDPRDDLSGLDIARKLLILARESGLELELNDVVIEPLLSINCQKAVSVEAFYTALNTDNGDYEALITRANMRGERLRYIAQLENGKARITLKGVSSDHPFYNLSGSDNMIVFKTVRYFDRPLVIRGPGAGASVTAAGVFAEVIRIASTGE